MLDGLDAFGGIWNMVGLIMGPLIISYRDGSRTYNRQLIVSWKSLVLAEARHLLAILLVICSVRYMGQDDIRWHPD